MRYHGAVIRPPSEATSLILQVTYGCSNNTCDFCGTYLDKPFAVRPLGEVAEDVTGLPAAVKARAQRVFLADGDALALSTRRLLEILDLLHAELPNLERVSSYANAKNLLDKEVDELRAAPRARARPPVPRARVGRRPDARRHPQGHDGGASRSRAAGGRRRPA